MDTVEWNRDYVSGRLQFNKLPLAWNCKGRTRWNLLLTDQGECTVCNEFGELTMRKNDMVICAPSEHRFFRTAGVWHSFWFHFDPAIQIHWEEPLRGVFRFQSPVRLFRRLLADAVEAHQLIQSGDRRNTLLTENLLVNLILRGNLYSAVPGQSEKMLQCAQYLASVSELPAMEAVARKFGMSRAKLFADFKRDYGVAPHTYFEQNRLRKVKYLLANTDLSFSEIAFECGYKSLSYLSRRFRAACGRNPGDYRKSCWGKNT